MPSGLSDTDARYYREIFNRVAATDGIDGAIAAVVTAERMGRVSLGAGPAVTEALADIVDDICRRYVVSQEELLGPCRRQRFAQPRQELYVAMRQMRFSYGDIGRFIGGRDHATVIAGIRVFNERRATDAVAEARAA